MLLVVPGYVLVWIFAAYLNGGYDKPLRISRVVRGILSGTIFILVVYALLNETYRFSRALILMNTAWACLITALIRYTLNAAGIKGFALAADVKKKLIVVADAVDAKRILSLLQLSGSNTTFVGYVDSGVTQDGELKNFRLGTLTQLNEIITIYQVDEVIFSSHSLSSQQIIENMGALRNRQVEYKIAPPESLFIIGSNSINDNGDLYLVDVNTLHSPSNRRKKRFFDIFSAFGILFCYPFLWLLFKKNQNVFVNSIAVLFGKKTWVATNIKSLTSTHAKVGVYTPSDGLNTPSDNEYFRDRLNVLYTRDYNMINDWNIVRRNIFK